MERFRRDYVALLDRRLATIRRCVDECRTEEARVALLSLESSSGMIGAAGLVARLHDLRSGLETTTAAVQSAMVHAVEDEAVRVRALLQDS